MGNKIFTIQEAKAADMYTGEYWDGVYEYETYDGFLHLIINGIDVLQGLDAVNCFYCSNGVYQYTIYRNGYYHFYVIFEGVNVLKGLNARRGIYHHNGVVQYENQDREWHQIKIH